ncbi:MAG TPA: SHOCT domain-containing protein [Mycobacteriales bacterium]|nr:SHOCT domain-containing protein [Mycobacteriales bacterium]
MQSVTTSSPAEEIARLADLKANGTITEAEYEQLKAKALAS